MKYTHGMRVTCKIKGEEIKDAKISIGSLGRIYICQNIKNGTDTIDKLGYKYSWCIDSGTNLDLEMSSTTDLKPAEITWSTLQEGDEIKNVFGRIHTVLGICGKIIFLSYTGDKNRCASYYTAEELKNDGYTIVQPTPPEPEIKEITLDEIAEKFGIDVKNVRIKE